MSVIQPTRDPIIHIHGQFSWHGEAYIVANAEGLLRLMTAINEAMANGIGVEQVFTNDGEGYYLGVKLIEGDDAEISAATPYIADFAKDNRDNAIQPWDRKDLIEAIRDVESR